MNSFEPALVRIETYLDMEKRAAFKAPINENEDKPVAILGGYDFADEIPCGLSGCRRKHKRGYLVVTEKGDETNIGHICGASHFGEFEILRKQFTQRRTVSAHFEIFGAYLAQRDEIEASIRRLGDDDRGARWAHKCHKIYAQECPNSIKQKLLVMDKTGDWTLYVEKRVRAEDQVDLGFRRNEQFERERVGEILGGAAVRTSAVEILAGLRRQMSEFDAITDLANLGAGTRRKWVEWITSIPAELERAERAIASARVFFTGSNLSQLQKIARDDGERTTIRGLVDEISRVGSERPQSAKK